jgi:hypothetical protein
MRILVGTVFLCAALAVLAAPGTLGKAVDPLQTDGPAMALLDPEQQLRRVVDPEIAGELAGRLQREAHRGHVWTETLFATLAVATAQINELDASGRMSDSNRHEIAALTALLVVDKIVELHPGLAPVVAANLSGSDDDPSPIERICACDRRGSRACGCRVLSTGAGSCEYRVMCPGVLKAGCSAVNIEMCIAETVIGLFSTFQ